MEDSVPNGSWESHPISIDLNRARMVLSTRVFSGPDAALRELIANAADSISMLPGAAMGHVEIRLIIDAEGGVLSVRDSGTGMTADQAMERLGRLFSSTKLDRHDVVGWFGIGFFAAMPLCEQVEVRTRTRNAGDEGTVLLFREEHDYFQFKSEILERPGTEVRLHLKPSFRQEMLNPEWVRGVVERYCDFIAYPIYLGDRWGIVNRMDAAWYRPGASEAELSSDLQKVMGIQAPLWCGTVHGELGEGLGLLSGVLAVVAGAECPGLRLYANRVMVLSDARRYLPDALATMVSGILDVPGLPVVLSRDAIREDDPRIRALGQLILGWLALRLAELADSRTADFRQIFQTHRATLKRLGVDDFARFGGLLPHMPVRTSQRSGIPLREVRPDPGMESLRFADREQLTAALLPLYIATGVEVVFLDEEDDPRVRKQLERLDPKRWRFKRLDIAPPDRPAGQSEDAPGDHQMAELIRGLMHSALGRTFRIKISPLGVDGPPVVVSMSEESRKIFQVAKSVRLYHQRQQLDKLPDEVRDLLKRNPSAMNLVRSLERDVDATLLFNSASPLYPILVHRLSTPANLRVNPELDHALANFLFDQALLVSGLILDEKEFMDLALRQTALVAKLTGMVIGQPPASEDRTT